MKIFFCVLIAFALSNRAFCQRNADTLSMTNYAQKAISAVATLDPIISLSPGQVDSAVKIYKDYYLHLIQLRSQPSAGNSKAQGAQSSRNLLEMQLKKILTPGQYRILAQKRQEDYQNRIHLMDSLFSRHH